MALIDTNITGLKETKAALMKLEGAERSILPPVVGSTADYVEDQGKNYPSPRGRYSRTGALRRGWIVKREGPLRATVLNTVSYARYVYSAQDQAQVHRGRWTTDSELAQRGATVARNRLLKALRLYTR